MNREIQILDGEQKVVIVDNVAKISQPKVNESNEFKANYDRFIVVNNPTDKFRKLRRIINTYQAEAYSEKPPVIAKIVTHLYTPSPKITPGGNFLDVGCSTGDFISNLPKIWKSTGLEINTSASIIAKSRGLKIVNTPLEKLITNKKYDVIRASHVIEHIKDIEPFLSKIDQILTERGLLVIYTPNLNSLSQKIFGRFWEGYYDETHFNIYDQESLKKALATNQFIVKKTRTYYMGYSVSSTLRILNINNTKLRVILTCVFLFLTLPVEIILGLTNKGDALYVEVTKK